jgi:hypothetical protein
LSIVVLILFPAVVLIVPVADVIDLSREEVAKQFYVKTNPTVVFTKPYSIETELEDVICFTPTELDFNRLVSGDLAIILDVIRLLNPGSLEGIL